jgi:hypothetical protein
MPSPLEKRPAGDYFCAGISRNSEGRAQFLRDGVPSEGALTQTASEFVISLHISHLGFSPVTCLGPFQTVIR